MLASVYSYRVMVKSVSSCCVRGRRVLSNPVSYTDGTVSVVNLDKATTLNNFFGIVLSQGYVHVFPRDACFPHTYHKSNNWLHITVICVSQRNVFPLKFH